MTQQHWVAVCALALASFAASAQPAVSRPDPLDATATVPPAIYKSAFEGYQRTSDAQQQPSADKMWRQANADLVSPDEHSEHSGHTAPAQVPAPPAPAATAPAAAAAVDHSKHH